MIDEHGARRQESLKSNQYFEEISKIYTILKGVIQPNGVMFKDYPGNKSGITLLNISLYGGYPDIPNVPIQHGKINNMNGEDWTPEPGDVVLVQFINGNFWEPIVTGYFPLPSNEIEATQAQAPPGGRRYFRKISKTSEEIDKDGNRTTIIQGTENVTVNTGDITITVVEGKCTVNVQGQTAWTSDGGIIHDGTGAGEIKGVSQGDCICAYTGKNLIMVSASVKASV